MGRHSLEDERAFFRSVLLFVLKWVTLALLPLLAASGFIRWVLQADEERKGPPTVTASPAPSPSPGPSPSPATGQLRGRIQVLNGSSAEGAGNRAADRFRSAGYEVVAVEKAARPYERTTVFYQPGSEQVAREIAAVVGAEIVEPAPANLDKTIPVTVVLGEDFRL